MPLPLHAPRHGTTQLSPIAVASLLLLTRARLDVWGLVVFIVFALCELGR